jgi:predicted molibdopterin-dependent oxidoreductase YjgC
MFKRQDVAVRRTSAVTLRVDGAPVTAFAGESVAAALAAAGILRLRFSPGRDDPRGMFCLMGVCQECVARIDGRVVVTCQEPVRDGMVVELGVTHG